MKTEYKYWRKRGQNATVALKLARADIADEKERYPSVGNDWNPPWSGFGESAMRWTENPEKCGLRFVGYADQLARLNHTGWYLDEHGMESARGIVYQLPARNGQPIFVCGYADPNNGTDGREWENPAALSMAVIYGESGYFSESARDNPGAADAARHADSITETMAVLEREHSAAYSARSKFEDAAEQIKTIRRAALELISDIKKLCPELTERAAASSALRTRLESMLSEISELRAERKTLESDYAYSDGWKDY